LFRKYKKFAKLLKTAIYFCFPYYSWQKDLVENTNGLLRQFFPKKESLENITQNKISRVVKLINNRPRKRHNYLTPNKVFERNLTRSLREIAP